MTSLHSMGRAALPAFTIAALSLIAPLHGSAHGSEIPAFPQAEGFGKYAQGGRGGRVIKVTSLADSGPGSLRAALEEDGPRIILFETGGTIDLSRPLRIRNSHVTIAGQSAPGGGITLRHHPLVIQADEVVVRFLRVRLGAESGQEADAVSVVSGQNIMIDHVSVSWSTDETLSISHSRSSDDHADNVTVQWSIISESLNRSVHEKGDHGYGTLLRGQRGSKFTFHHNLWAHHMARMPRPGNWYDASEDPQGTTMDFRNNVFYNWGRSVSGYNADKTSLIRYNFINNEYLQGPNSKGAFAFEESNPFAKAYFAGNRMDGALPDDPWKIVRSNMTAGYRQDAPFPAGEIGLETAEAAYDHVLRFAGASLSYDPVDLRVINSVRTRTGRIIDNEKDVGGWPAIAQGSAPTDTDADGIPDEWERSHRLNPADAEDSRARTISPPYTNLEAYLNELAAPAFPSHSSDSSG